MSDVVKLLMDHMGIKHCTSSIYYLASNGQVERTNTSYANPLERLLQVIAHGVIKK